MSGAASAPRHGGTTVIRPESGITLPDFREIWAYRDLLYYLVRRDFVVRYKQSVVGVLWAVLQPLALTVVYSVFLGALADVPSQSGIPYPLFALVGLTMWLFFSRALQTAAESTVNSADLLSKVYFPRILVPVAALLASTIDFLVAFGVVFLALFVYGHPPGIELLAMPLVIVVAMLVALGAGLWSAALLVKYRDIRQIIAFVVLAGLFVTPVVYPFELVPAPLQPVYALNPVVGILELYRWSLFGMMTADLWVLAIPMAVAVVTTVSGILYFRAAERTFADVV